MCCVVCMSVCVCCVVPWCCPCRIVPPPPCLELSCGRMAGIRVSLSCIEIVSPRASVVCIVEMVDCRWVARWFCQVLRHSSTAQCLYLPLEAAALVSGNTLLMHYQPVQRARCRFVSCSTSVVNEYQSNTALHLPHTVVEWSRLSLPSPLPHTIRSLYIRSSGCVAHSNHGIRTTNRTRYHFITSTQLDNTITNVDNGP